jgi:hypothetical protein
VRKWGPSTRNIIRSIEYDIAKHPEHPDPIEQAVLDAVNRIQQNQSVKFLSGSQASSVIFHRRVQGSGKVQWESLQLLIPTQHLINTFEEGRNKMTNSRYLDLFCTLSSHALTRTATGWAHEKLMHERLVVGGGALIIFQGTTESVMQPSRRLLPGTLAGLKQAGAHDSFYWMPSAANFNGVDSVLGDENGNVYTIQATIASAHTGPQEGIRKVWDHFNSAGRAGRTWHYVIVTNNQQDANKYEEEWSQHLQNFTLGAAHNRVQVWGCVLK